MAKIDYSVIGLDDKGRYVTDPICADLDIRADGYPTVEAAVKEGAPGLFGQSPKVVRVLVRESVQELSGGSWRAGRVVQSIDRTAPEQD
ncbi:hypothetical protein [Streptomyces sp. 5-10]|uniref:hypothetical protein n=1 Tax=Streptomyces sp. 5-10 TaxID=878925 RepID=UPI00168B2429|nr:hypothetical protein [Streptomyces sp. 5-10]MBD3004622.1 hypothetical protein [Streptomyces sp. 5-10]